MKDLPAALLVPQTAIGSSQLGKFVSTIGEDDKVEQKLVSRRKARRQQF